MPKLPTDELNVIVETVAPAIPPPTPPDQLLKAQTLLKRLGGISLQTLWRYQKDPDLNFPKPILIHSIRYWRSGDIDAWMESLRGGK